MEPLRILCARELQNSIMDSVHKLLSDQIELLGLRYFYDVQQARIIGANGTVITFEGIKNNTTKIKSYEGIDICWVEEAEKTSKTSWGILIPTIRKEGSQIILTFNPALETDYTFVRFVKDQELMPTGDPTLPSGILESPSSYVVKMTYKDNPWFTKVMQLEMEGDRKRDYDYYLNVWEGHCLQNLEGAVLAKELRRAQEEGRIGWVPWDREVAVDTFWDLGKRDATAIWFAQRVAMQNRILAYFEGRGEDIPFYLNELQRRGYVYGTHWLPHDAFAKRLGTRRTIEEQIRDKYPGMVKRVPSLSVADGINATRMIFSSCWFDENECSDGLQSLRHWKFKVVEGQFSQFPEHSDSGDAFRYLAISLGNSRGDARVGTIKRLSDRLKGRLGGGESGNLNWMG